MRGLESKQMFAIDSATPPQPKLALAADAPPVLCADQEPNSLKEIQLTDNEKRFPRTQHLSFYYSTQSVFFQCQTPTSPLVQS